MSASPAPQGGQPLSFTDRQVIGDAAYIASLEHELKRRPSGDNGGGLAKLRERFTDDKIGQLPRVTCRDCRERKCNEHRVEWCEGCRQMIGKHIHLDYVGHALVTERLIDADRSWWWEPVAWETEGARAGLPRFIRRTVVVGSKENRREIPDCAVGMWAWLHVCGTKTLGYGSLTDQEAAEDPEKKLISDFIRSAAMRRGVALELWSKEGLVHEGRDEEPPPEPVAKAAKPPKDTRPAAEKKLDAKVNTVVAMGSTKAADAERAEMGAAFGGAQDGAGSKRAGQGVQVVLGFTLQTTWTQARAELIGERAAKSGPYPPVPDLAKKTWDWASQGEASGLRETWLSYLIGKAREAVAASPQSPLLWDLQRAICAYNAMIDRLNPAPVAPISEGDA